MRPRGERVTPGNDRTAEIIRAILASDAGTNLPPR